MRKVTIYTKSELFGNVIAIEAKLIEHGRKTWAQYDAAPFVRFVAKRKRSESEIVGGFAPFILIVDGWNQPTPASIFGESTTSANGVSTSRSRFRSFDPEMVAEFKREIAGKVSVVAAYHG